MEMLNSVLFLNWNRADVIGCECTDNIPGND